MKRIGAVIKFKAHVTKEEAAFALEKLDGLAGILDIPAQTSHFVKEGKGLKIEQRTFSYRDLIKDYESDHGEPVWYIP
jgi:hypothetical protein